MKYKPKKTIILSIIMVIIVGCVCLISFHVRTGADIEIPFYTDENGDVYAVAFLKSMTDSTVTVDVLEFVTRDNEERVKELNLTESDLISGYYIHNPDTKTITWNLDNNIVYTFVDWGGDFTESGYPEEYTTTDTAIFQQYVGTYDHSLPGMPFFFQVESGTVKLILEKPMA